MGPDALRLANLDLVLFGKTDQGEVLREHHQFGAVIFCRHRDQARRLHEIGADIGARGHLHRCYPTAHIISTPRTAAIIFIRCYSILLQCRLSCVFLSWPAVVIRVTVGFAQGPVT